MWELIRANQRRSAILISCMVALLLTLGWFVGEAILPGGGKFGVLVALGVWFIQLLVYFTAAESILLNTADAREIKHEDSPRLFNIVDEMRIASGLGAMPRVFLIDDPRPNAFAVGRKPASSAVAVTTGLMQRLNRDELQGVIGHEVGHLKNGDVKFMTLAAVMVGSIVMLADGASRMMRGMGRGSSRSRSRSGGSGGGQAQLIILLVAIVLMILAPILAQILYFACSRKREYLADASSALYTRYPAGLASALQKIAGSQDGAGFATKVTAPMFIVNPLQAANGDSASVFSTHPPTSERVRILRGMAGAALGDYEAAYRQAKGGSVLMSAGLVQSAAHEDIRESSAESGEGFAVGEVRSIMRRLDGYITVNCPCGLRTNVPMEHEGNEIHCVRCGRTLPLPTAEESESSPASEAGSLQGNAAQPPSVYVRHTNGWESFRCPCGRTLQLSPSFAAPQLSCTACGRKITVLQSAA